MTRAANRTPISKCVRFAGVNAANLPRNPETLKNWRKREIGLQALAGRVSEAPAMGSAYTQCGWMKSLNDGSTSPTADSRRKNPGGPRTILRSTINLLSSRGTSTTSGRTPLIFRRYLTSKRIAVGSTTSIQQISALFSNGLKENTNRGDTGNHAERLLTN